MAKINMKKGQVIAEIDNKFEVRWMSFHNKK